MSFLKRRISVSVLELLILLVIAIVFATVYRLYFSRAVTLTQVCERIETLQKRQADMTTKLEGDAADALNEINRLCQVRRPGSSRQ